MQKHKLLYFFQKLPTLPFVYFSDVRRSKGQQAMTKTAFGYPLQFWQDKTLAKWDLTKCLIVITLYYWKIWSHV